MSGTVCSYKGCSKSYSQDKDISFFKFPDDPKRRKKWMEHCTNPELLTLNDRQLRLKRVCADHFSPISFISSETRNQLTEKAVPLSQKEQIAAFKAQEEAQQQQQGQPPKRGRGRPPKFSLVLVKKEAEDVEEEDQEKSDSTEKENGDIDLEYSPPPTLRKQNRNETVSEPKPKGRPPKLVAVNHDSRTKPKESTESKLKPKDVHVKLREVEESKVGKIGRRKSNSGRRMADLSVIDQVVNEIQLEVNEPETAKNKKRSSSGLLDERILKRMKSEDSEDESMDEESEEEDIPERANREFEKFQEGLRKIITLPPRWGMGGVIWDPMNKTKVIAISEADVQINGLVRMLRSVLIYEDNDVKISIDGVDMTMHFGITSISSENDVGGIIDKVAACVVCSGVHNFQPDDIIYHPYAKKRGCTYYSDACPIILSSNVTGTVCNPCATLQSAVQSRKEKEKQEIESRKARATPNDLRNDFGKSLYGLLFEILDDADALKSDRKQDRDAVLSKYSSELNVMNGEIQKPEKLPHINVSVDEVSASFQDIVSRLGFSTQNKAQKPGTPQPVRKPREDERRAASMNSLMAKVNRAMGGKSGDAFARQSHTSTGNYAQLADGQTYEIVGEVGGSEGSKGEAIEIIEVDDETMAKLTAQNSGMFFQNSAPGTIQVATLDPSDPNISQILKAIDPSQSFKEA